MLKKLSNMLVVLAALGISVPSEAGRHKRFKKETTSNPIVAGPVVFPGKIPPEIWLKIMLFLPAKDFVNLRKANPRAFRLVPERILKEKKLQCIMPELVELKKGSFIFGDLEPDPHSSYGGIQFHAHIKRDFWMSKDPVTQEKYIALMGRRKFKKAISRFSDTAFQVNLNPNAPMTILTEAEETEYIEKLNKVVRELWPQIHPGEAAPVFRKTTEVEWEYGTTKPLLEPKVIEFQGQQVVITAEHMKYSGTNEEAALAKYAVFGKKREDGPFPVNHVNEETGKKLEVNGRGLRGMSGGVWERTLTIWRGEAEESPRRIPSPAERNGSTSWVLRGGYWVNDAFHCRSSQRKSGDGESHPHVGFRLAAEYPSN